VPAAAAQEVVTVEPEAEKVVAAAKADLMERLGVAEEAVVVQSVDAVQWPDSSLGCPQPGMMYLQVITPGFRVLLEAAGQTHEYHTDRDLALILCNNLPSLKLPPPKSADDRTPWQPIDGRPNISTP
jgi:hypothetical protein